jgi:DNA-directed RNA polymerase specialized sigma24 family protein
MDLPEEQGRALLLSYWSGYTQQELAALTGVAVSVVRARMLAGMTVLTQARQDSTSVAPSARQTG